MTPEPSVSSAAELALAGASMVEAAAESVVQVSGRGRGGPGGWGAGAGFVWGDEGLVMTNHHVVAGAARRGRSRALTVALRDGRSFDAEVVRHSRNLDLALLRLTGDTGSLPALRLGDSDVLRVGSLVYAIGHPWGRSGTVTSGIVSGIGATRWPGGRRANLVQSDVVLAPGNSGGPLLDAKGEVVGVNAMISGSLALSVPSNAAALWAAGAEDQRPDGARLGVGILPQGCPTHAADAVPVWSWQPSKRGARPRAPA